MASLYASYFYDTSPICIMKYITNLDYMKKSKTPASPKKNSFSKYLVGLTEEQITDLNKNTNIFYNNN